MGIPITEDEIKRFVANWYRALDIHASVEDCVQFLADSGLEMIFPEKTLRGLGDFRAWYAGGEYSDGTKAPGVINIFFDETHTVQSVKVQSIEARISGEEAVVDLFVGWQASWWELSEAKSKRTSLDSMQRWMVRRSSKNAYGLELITYNAVVEPFKYAPGFAQLQQLPKPPTVSPGGQIEIVATFDGSMPTGVTVSRKDRIFVNFPRWGDSVDFTVAELKDGKPVPYPDATFNRLNKDRPAECLVSVQSVVVDSDDQLWLLDTGSTKFGPTLPGGPKLVGADLRTNKIFKTISFPREVALETTYLNDVRFDLSRGKEGVAYITDSSAKGPNGLIVVDLATSQSRRRLHDHPSTKADKNFLPIVEGRPLMNRLEGEKPSHMTDGADGIAISHDGKFLYYCPLSSRRLYRVRTDALLDEKAGDEEVAKVVEDLGDRGFASDGLESDDRGRLYLTDYEDNAILRRDDDGNYETLVYDPRVLWPDTLCLAANGHLYFTANQLHRGKGFQGSKDLRQRPYSLFRIKVDAGPVLLRPAP